MTHFAAISCNILYIFRQPHNWQGGLPFTGFAMLSSSKAQTPHCEQLFHSMSCAQDWIYHFTEPRNCQKKSIWKQTAACQILICLPVVVQAADNLDMFRDISGNT